MTTGPITFSCVASLKLEPEEIASNILNLSNWPDFDGYGPLPGITEAEFEVQKDEIIGTRIRVTNRDGSTHIEEIIEWLPSKQLCLRMQEFSPPVSGLATHFIERWQFERNGSQTIAIRTFEMFPKSFLTRPIIWLISCLLKRAIDRHLRQMEQQ